MNNKLTDEHLRQRTELLRSQYTGSLETLHFVYDADVIDELLSARAKLRECRQSKGAPVGYMVGSALLENMTQAIAYKADSSLQIQPLYTSQQHEAAINQAVLINKFYERYPLNTFKSDSERAEALGYFMAGAELQCYGDFIAYEGGNGDE